MSDKKFYIDMFTLKIVKPKREPKTKYWIDGDEWNLEKSAYNEWEAWNVSEQLRDRGTGQGTTSYSMPTKRELLAGIGWTGKDQKQKIER